MHAYPGASCASVLATHANGWVGLFYSRATTLGSPTGITGLLCPGLGLLEHILVLVIAAAGAVNEMHVRRLVRTAIIVVHPRLLDG